MRPAVAFAALIAASVSFAASAAEVAKYTLVIENHQFSPSTLEVPAGKPFKLVVENKDATPEEFESHDFNREKVIPGNSSATIKVGALKPGTHKFFGEFHEATAKGTIIAK